MDLTYVLMIVIPAVLAAVLLILNAVKDKTETTVDDKASGIIARLLELLGKKQQ